MKPEQVYEEALDFFASGPTPNDIRNFQATDAVKAHVRKLIHREKEGELSSGELSELEKFLRLEHLIRLAKVQLT